MSGRLDSGLGLVQTIIDPASTGLRRRTSGSLDFKNEQEWLQPRHASNTQCYWLHRGVSIPQEPTIEKHLSQGIWSIVNLQSFFADPCNLPILCHSHDCAQYPLERLFLERTLVVLCALGEFPIGAKNENV